MTKVGDILEFGGIAYRVIDTGPLMGVVKDEKGKEREEVLGLFVHVERVDERQCAAER